MRAKETARALQPPGTKLPAGNTSAEAPPAEAVAGQLLLADAHLGLAQPHSPEHIARDPQEMRDRTARTNTQRLNQ
eukprot:13488739-Heterocapsa_arctica.AAC.1